MKTGNSVELLGHYGGDIEHACSAWTSTSRELTDEKRERIPKLLAMLAREGHLTPFEKSSLHFLVTCDDATHIHILKHRISVSVNGESARYKELKDDKFYIPPDWRGDDPWGTLDLWAMTLVAHSEESARLYHECLKDLTPVLGRKRAKESARYFLPKNNQITLDVMFNWRSFAHFQQLRNDDHAQLEVKTLAGEMLELVRNIPGEPFKYTLEAFGWGVGLGHTAT
jgi:thymidylate synthase (FAD)